MAAKPTDGARASRRGFLAGAGGLVAAGLAAPALADAAGPVAASSQIEPFWGPHQAGIVTPSQSQTYFASFDLQTDKRGDVEALLRCWTEVAARLAAGQPAGQMDPVSDDAPAADSGDALGLSAAGLTLTFGFGADLFSRDGRDRYGLAARRPAALVDLPRFNGDQMIPGRTGGALSIQACADDQQVAFHAIRQLARLADGIATLRWSQAGFSPKFGVGATPRNLMGFKDGTSNPATATPEATTAAVWAGDEGPAWMRGGSYLVARRIRIALEHWDRMDVPYQEATIGRRKRSGAPLGGTTETDAADFAAKDADGNAIVPISAHIRTGTPASHGGALIHRRGFSYNDGVAFTAERWPPWHQGIEYDAGSFFLCYQRDPRTGFIKIFETMAKIDAMNQFTTHTGGGLFACPPGAAPGGFIGQALFES